MLVNEVINAKDLPVMEFDGIIVVGGGACLLYTSPSPRDRTRYSMQ